MVNGNHRVGIAGRRGLAFLSGLRSLPHTEVIAFCEPDPNALREGSARHGIPLLFNRFDSMLDAVDVVVVASPMQFHAPQSILALQAGKHVLSEVTAAVSLEECWRLLDAVHASGKTYMMAENYCYMQENVLVGEMARQGLFGELYFGEGEYLHEVRAMHHTVEGNPTWRYYWQVGMNGCTYGTHSLGPVMQWFTGVDPSEHLDTVTCLGTGRHTDPEHPHDDTTLMLCKLRSGKLIKVRLDMMSNRPHLWNYYALQGTLGVYEASRIEGEPGRIWLGANRPDEHRAWRPVSDFETHLPSSWRERSAEAIRTGHGGGDYHVSRTFMEAVISGTPPPIDVYRALEWTAAGLCSVLSISNGGVPIRVPDFGDAAQRPIWLDSPATA